jgi:hypothetical protein
LLKSSGPVCLPASDRRKASAQTDNQEVRMKVVSRIQAQLDAAILGGGPYSLLAAWCFAVVMGLTVRDATIARDLVAVLAAERSLRVLWPLLLSNSSQHGFR